MIVIILTIVFYDSGLVISGCGRQNQMCLVDLQGYWLTLIIILMVLDWNFGPYQTHSIDWLALGPMCSVLIPQFPGLIFNTLMTHTSHTRDTPPCFKQWLVSWTFHLCFDGVFFYLRPVFYVIYLFIYIFVFASAFLKTLLLKPLLF